LENIIVLVHTQMAVMLIAKYSLSLYVVNAMYDHSAEKFKIQETLTL
jgi:hypothetical protein